jgi:nucleoside-diphosphate-sugar epimerase
MNVIVTGGNGFLGSNIVRKLLKENHNVYVISNNTNNIQDILHQIKYSSEYTDEINQFKPDAVVHFGWKGGNNSRDVNYTNQFYDNMPMSLDLLIRLNSLPHKPKFIGVGSFAEYGDYTSSIKESDIEKPLTLYGLTKLTLKKYTEMMCSQNGSEWAWIRPCYVYGPGDVSTRLIPTIINKCLKEEPINLDSCNKFIDYLYIDDFCNYVYHIITNKSQGVYNLSSGNQQYLKNVVNLIHNLVGNNNTVSFENNTTPVKWICGDNTKIKTESSLYSLIDFEKGLIKTINYYKNEKSSNIKR